MYTKTLQNVLTTTAAATANNDNDNIHTPNSPTYLPLYLVYTYTICMNIYWNV